MKMKKISDKLMEVIGNEKIRKIKLGVELEIYLFDNYSGNLFYDSPYNFYKNLREKLIEKLPKNVWYDYYPYQLEIRSNPHDNPNTLIEEIRDLYLKTQKIFNAHDISLHPRSNWRDAQHNGMHIHFSLPDFHGDEYDLYTKYYEIVRNLYPHIVTLAILSRNSKVDDYVESRRLQSSGWCVPLGERLGRLSRFIDVGHEYEININRIRAGERLHGNPTKYEVERRRLKSSSGYGTLEIKLFDVPPTFEAFSVIVKAIYKILTQYNNNKIDDDVLGWFIYDLRPIIYKKTYYKTELDKIGFDFLDKLNIKYDKKWFGRKIGLLSSSWFKNRITNTRREKLEKTVRKLINDSKKILPKYLENTDKILLIQMKENPNGSFVYFLDKHKFIILKHPLNDENLSDVKVLDIDKIFFKIGDMLFGKAIMGKENKKFFEKWVRNCIENICNRPLYNACRSLTPNCSTCEHKEHEKVTKIRGCRYVVGLGCPELNIGTCILENEEELKNHPHRCNLLNIIFTILVKCYGKDSYVIADHLIRFCEKKYLTKNHNIKTILEKISPMQLTKESIENIIAESWGDEK